MTREEAIQILRDTPIDIRSTREDDIHTLYATAQMMAIESLSAEYEDYEHATLVDIKEPLKVLVVRCKDCRHYEDGMIGHCWETERGVSADFFCAYGERREK